MVRLLRNGVLGVFAMTVLLVAAPAAFAEEAWWHVTSGTRPGNLHFGTAQDEVQELAINSGEFNGRPASIFLLSVDQQEVGLFLSKAVEEELGFGSVATAANVQEALEGVYGKGNVSVTGGIESSPGVLTPFVVKTVGEAADQEVGRIEVENEVVAGNGPSNILVAGRPDGEIALSVENVGDANADGESAPIEIADKLPPGVRAVAISGARPDDRNFLVPLALSCSLKTVSCTVANNIIPFDQIEVRVSVVVEKEPVSPPLNEVTVSGGKTPEVAVRRPLKVSNAPTPYGIESYELTPEEEGGVPATQAGVHPFQLTTTIVLNQGEDSRERREVKPVTQPVQLPKDVNLKWPPGLIGNPTPLPQCPINVFVRANENEGFCPTDSIVGVAVVFIDSPGVFGALRFEVPLINLTPAAGEPARFGFFVSEADVPVYIDTSIRTGGDYGITVKVHNISQVSGFLSSEVTVWGVPEDPRHDKQRGDGCLIEAKGGTPIVPCEPPKTKEQEEANPPVPFLQMPTSCTGPLQTSGESDSWAEARPEGEEQTFPGGPMPAMDGCNRAPFGPSLVITPDGKAGSTPTGLNVDVHNPQENTLSAKGLAEPDVRDIAVALPEGMAIDPAGADGLQACSAEEVGYLPDASEPPENLRFTPTLPTPFCPNGSKVGTATVKTPLLPHALHGAVYLAEQDENPFKSLVAMYVIVEDPISGSIVKLPGEVKLDEKTGQVVTTFINSPQFPFEDAELHFFGGERAPLATPAHCGVYKSSATFTPWTGTEPVTSTSSVEIDSGPDGSPCPGASLPFNPTLTAGTTSIQAGGFSPFTMTMSREDGEQQLKSIELHMPPGMSGTLTGVKLCGEQPADEGTCGPESEIGETIVSVGLGGHPFSVKGGKVYLTGPYKGAPFGLSIVNPAKAGPFDLGKVIVRAKVEVDPLTTALTITTDTEGPYKLPTILDGIPLAIRHVNVDIDRAKFTFNPSNCSPMQLTGKLGSIEGANSPVSVPFQVTNCAVLAFKPRLTASTSGKVSRLDGTSLHVKLSYPAGPYDANIARVKVELPKGLPSRLATLQKACAAAAFEANPASCPPASIIGHATATTPILPVPLSGPAYFVSHGGEAFPSLIVVLQGYGVTVHLVGSTYISKRGVTSSTFKAVPDAPVGSFELTLPAGPYSALTGLGNLCKAKTLQMPTEFVGQNGAEVHTITKIAVTGCGKAKKATRKKAHRKKRKPAKKAGKKM